MYNVNVFSWYSKKEVFLPPISQGFLCLSVSNKSIHQWSPNSPNLNPQPFFLWVFLKDRLYINRPQSIQALKTNITNEINQIPREMRENVMEKIQRRLEVCLERNGGHLGHVIKNKDD